MYMISNYGERERRSKLQSNKDIRFTTLGGVWFFFSGQGVEAKKWLVETPLERKNVRISKLNIAAAAAAAAAGITVVI